MKRIRPIFFVLVAAAIIGASFGLGVGYGYQSRPEIEKVLGVLNQKPINFAQGEEVDFAPFWKAWRILEEKYVGESAVDRQALVWGAIEGMTKSIGDPYTTFFPPKDAEDFKNEIKGEFSGIGAEIGIRKEILVVIAPLAGSPAEKAGLRAGDKILKIDDVYTSDLTLDEAVHKIRGERGTKVHLTIVRLKEDTSREVEVTRDIIKVPVITTAEKGGSIFYIRLSSFSEKSSNEFASAVRTMLNTGSNKLILDLRNNPGGFLNSAVEIASWFLPEGDVVVREEYRVGDPDEYRSFGYHALENIQTVILVDRGSASASEILAGALQDYGKAVLMGEKTYGKGSVQQLEEVTSTTQLKITVAKWLTPKGKSISKEGLAPDIEVKVPDDLEPGSDPVLDEAITYLKKH